MILKIFLESKKRQNTLSKENNQEKFHKYTEKLEKSLIKYQMSYSTD